MALLYQHERDGELLPYRWGWWHAAIIEHCGERDHGPDVWKHHTELTVAEKHTYQDPEDGEIVTFLPGDTIRRYWS